MKHFLTFLIFCFIMGNLYTQSLNDDIISDLKSSFSPNQSDLAIRNAITNSSIKKLAQNHDVAKKQDHYFDIEVKSGSVTDQHTSGRCWMFTSLNVFRPVVMKKYNLTDFEFSQTYLYFWDILEKSNIFLERIIATADKDIYSREVFDFFHSPVNDGGAWNTFTNLVDKYGIVPKKVMPETKQSLNTRTLINIINLKLRENALNIRDMINENESIENVRNQKILMLKEIYRILALSLGEPPSEFSWRYKDKDGNISKYNKYTPLSFWKKSVNANLDDYVMFIDDPSREYYKLYSKEFDKNVYEGIDWTYVNIPAKDIKKFAIESLKDEQIMYFSCDVGKQLSKDDGTLDLNNFNYQALFGVDFNLKKSQRILSHQSGSSHGMALCGVDLDENGNPVKWKLENSWGPKYGNAGYLTMTDEWFDQYFFRMVINKKYLTDKVLDVLKQEPTTVPFYNPAFSADK